jgi:transposase
MMTENELQSRLPVIAHSATGADCVGCVVANRPRQGHRATLQRVLIDASILEILLSRFAIGLFTPTEK